KPEPAAAPAGQRPVLPGFAGLREDGHRRRPAVLRELLRGRHQRQRPGARLRGQHARPARHQPVRLLAPDRRLAEDSGFAGAVLPAPVRHQRRAHLGVPGLRQRLQGLGQLRRRPDPRLHRRGPAVALADGPDLDQLRDPAAQAAVRRARAPAVHVRRAVLAAAAMEYTAAQLAERFGLAVHGDPAARVSGVATLARATPSQLSFLANPRYRAQLADSRAGIVAMRAEDAEGYAGTALVARDPYAA